ncbi:hypothetical protein DKG77_10610 [Flagellimonas aquimarina]|uniref:tRNA_anti-like n=1 Tax=Flagellimonas aquimarina TaxID=2201895 RepID=A0A316KYN6_9FLAO|nr:hypothetical protein [Allomuricauda koreensis]PWL38691.1 hypothetical protein DKG77_10610 [Allomuricauda koreensis]
MNGKKKTIGSVLLLAVILLSVAVYNYLYKGHRNIAEEEIAHELSTKKLSDALRIDNASVSYIDKVIQTNGKITAIERNTIVIDNSVQVSFQGNVQGLTMENTISIKGRCVGYDDLLEVVKIDQAIIIKNN